MPRKALRSFAGLSRRRDVRDRTQEVRQESLTRRRALGANKKENKENRGQGNALRLAQQTLLRRRKVENSTAPTKRSFGRNRESKPIGRFGRGSGETVASGRGRVGVNKTMRSKPRTALNSATLDEQLEAYKN